MFKLLRNIINVSLSNILSLFSGVLVGFLVPKMLSMEGYANYKIYTLYLTYLPILSLGFCDGLYLKYSGLDKKELDKSIIHAYLKKYYIQLGILCGIACLLVIFWVPVDYKMISICLAIAILTSQITCVHQNISLLTSSFNEYSVRVITNAILRIILVLSLFSMYKLCNNEIPYQLFIGGIILIDFILMIWYIYTYRDINFFNKKRNISIENSEKYSHLLLIGFPLLISNMAGSIFMGLDRQFVSFLFEKEQYAIYAFAYNLLTLITTLTSAVSVVLFPSLRKITNIDISASLNKLLPLFNVAIAGGLIVYFPLCWFIPVFLPKYFGSLEILRIILPGLILSSSVSVILINFYKLENKIVVYFWITIISIIISILSNYIAFKVFHTYLAISWASILSILVWYLCTMLYFKHLYNFKLAKNVIYISLIGLFFYIVTGFIQNIILAGLIYFGIYSIITILFNYTTLRLFYKKYRTGISDV